MPETKEIFGQVFLRYTTNFDLKPESSDNFNLGFHYNRQMNSENFFSTDVNIFYRRTKDFIKEP